LLAFSLYTLARLLIDQIRGIAVAPGALGLAVDWLQLAVVLPFAVALRADVVRLRKVFLLALAGLLANMLWRVNWPLLLADLPGWLASREGFGFPSITFGLFAGAALLVVVLARWPTTGHFIVLRWVAGLMLVQGFLLTQARSAWLGFCIALGLGLVLRWLAWRVPLWRRLAGPRALLAMLLLLGVLGFNAGLVVDRLALEADSAKALLQRDLAPDDHSSIGLRWRAQQLGLRLWLERPLFGWGVNGTDALIAANAEAWGLIDNGSVLVHLHNSYLEILAQFGIVGLLLFVAAMFWLLSGLLSAWQQGRLPVDLAIALFCVLLMMLIWCLFNFRMLNQDWRGFWTLVAGAALSFGLAARKRFAAVPDISHGD
jgi:O-antigen ligase